MKLATERTRHRDGRLLVVSRDLTRCVPAGRIATTMQEALDRWAEVEGELRGLFDLLEAGEVTEIMPFDAAAMAAPLPRAWQWLDGSAYPTHGQLMQTAFGLPPIETDRPLMYQGMSHIFLGPTDDVPLPSEADGIDFEGELGVITGDVPMGVGVVEALQSVRLLVLVNDWSLRSIAPGEMKTGFGWIQAKPACSMAPVAVTPDELDGAWRDGRADAVLEVHRNDARFGAVPTLQMQFGFHDLIEHAARTRSLCAGTIIGSGTISSADYRRTGSCCIAERRAIEAIEHGNAGTGFLHYGETVRMSAHIAGRTGSIFGEIRQQVVRPDDLTTARG